MAKSKQQKLTKLFDSGDVPVENLEEVSFDSSSLKTMRLVPIDADLLRRFEADAREKRVSLEKLVNSFIRRYLVKAA